MARFSAGGTRAGTNTAGTNYWGLIPGTATAPARIREIGIGVAVAPANAPAFYISRQTAAGTYSTTLAGQPSDGTATTTSQYNFQTYSANGTFSATNFLRYGALAATAGGLLVWTFYDEPLIVSPTGGIVITNANATAATLGTFVAYAVWDE